jgi:hypothetical protein
MSAALADGGGAGGDNTGLPLQLTTITVAVPASPLSPNTAAAVFNNNNNNSHHHILQPPPQQQHVVGGPLTLPTLSAHHHTHEEEEEGEEEEVGSGGGVAQFRWKYEPAKPDSNKMSTTLVCKLQQFTV